MQKSDTFTPVLWTNTTGTYRLIIVLFCPRLRARPPCRSTTDNQIKSQIAQNKKFAMIATCRRVQIIKGRGPIGQKGSEIENHGQGGSNFETIFSTRVFATIFSLFEMFVLTISSPYQKKESYVKV